MIVIGIVGSKGKTTTANLLWAALSSGDHKIGQLGTANIRIGNIEKPNPWHMTMPGARNMQKLLSQMKQADCTHVIMEVPSEAQTQWRHIGINFDMIIFTGVEREIMAAHKNSMQLLHKHNKRVLTRATKSPLKIINGKEIPKTLIVNADSKDAKDYSNFSFYKKLTYSLENPSNFQAQDIQLNDNGTQFELNNTTYKINLIGKVNALNASAAVASATQLGAAARQIQKGFKNLQVIPGRMEKIDEGQKYLVFVDYAHDQISLEKLLETGRELLPKDKKMIVLFGGQGGGRDVAKRAEMGVIAGKLADYIVISDDDPYDDAPMQIIEDIAAGVRKAGKQAGKNLFLVQDRREGIHKALKLASTGDLVLIACKGADQLMMLAHNKSIAWDDRKVTREELRKILKS